MKKICFVTIFIILFAPSCQQKETLTTEEVVAAIQLFDKGWKEKNVEIVDSVLSKSYIYFTQSGGIFDRKNVVLTAGSNDYKLDTVLRKQFDIKIEGNVAVVNTVWTGKGTYFNSPFNDNQRCSITIIKNNGKVEILSEHCTPIK
ncbi:MAG: nuclear transport factor 2 family protein [Chitinophagaceae bacterium]|nr:nuclear transport factor 2 family protein [Chitinophagaceae bacterium]MBL0273017.1 nuclear transport factor 2 family protein [Chitinophagaceae bacterium]